ncbi:MAG TPA: hypothetical protein VFR90_10115 [Methylibium sp.]|uniref:hypothetical protein n=1 Tax=Methylibium sp. TaxID=2067992 RepID=UPI002DB6FDA1|nr:hypothetical protein [Methylibium sp.]HEU4459465.1 hypothetical protein [Methylibium sp.]
MPPSPAPSPTPGGFTISGRATYDFVPARANGIGLDYAATVARPIRGATVWLVDADDLFIAEATTDADGNYQLTTTTARPMFVRVYAEIFRSDGAPGGGRNITVRDNTAFDALYQLQGAVFTPAAAATTQNLHAASGWGGSSYTGPRVAAPFAVLDVAYAAQAKVASVSTVDLPTLFIAWSPSNRAIDGDVTAGEIGASRYENPVSIYLLGAADADTDEYDRHVVARELGSWLQTALSRDVVLEGTHGSADRLDMVDAFSHGWATAWAAMLLDDPVFTNASGAGQAGGSAVNLGTAPAANRGWYAEASVAHLLWAAHQTSGIGYAPIHQAFVALAQAPTFPSIYSFTAALKARAPAAAATIDGLWAGQNVVAQDAYGAGESNNGGSAANLPVYKTHVAALGATQNYCVNGSNGTPNKLGNRVYIRFGFSGTRTITATRISSTGNALTDPDFRLITAAGEQDFALSGDPDEEVLPDVALPAGTHVMALYDYNMLDSGSSGTSCFDVRVD